MRTVPAKSSVKGNEERDQDRGQNSCSPYLDSYSDFLGDLWASLSLSVKLELADLYFSFSVLKVSQEGSLDLENKIKTKHPSNCWDRLIVNYYLRLS